MKKLALMVYPNFSMQEIASICSFFKWEYDCETIVFSWSLDKVNSEEGICVKPNKIFEEFKEEDYHCLILPGCSDLKEPLHNVKIKEFLQRFKGNQEFVIGAICAGPIFLAQAGLLDERKFTCSLFVEMIEYFPFIKEENVIYQPTIEDGNIVTAVGFAFNEFAITVAKRLGFEVPDKIFTGVTEEKLNDITCFKQNLPSAYVSEFKRDFADLLMQE